MTAGTSTDRYATMPFRRCGRSGLKLPLISFGLWHNFGEDGSLTDRYLDGTVPRGSRAEKAEVLSAGDLTPELLSTLRGLAAIAKRRGQSLSQLALAWALRDERVTSVITGASSVAQLEMNLGALDNLDLSVEELAEIDSVLVANAG